jgi:hypothetical protein
VDRQFICDKSESLILLEDTFVISKQYVMIALPEHYVRFTVGKDGLIL